jgi:trans-2,3-dihydro-3-hydroxyanthranilate isomerase
VTLEMQVGVVSVAAGVTNALTDTADRDIWTLDAKPPKTRPVSASQEEIAAMLSLSVRDLGPTPLWVDTGSEQLVIPLASVDAVQRTAPIVDLLAQYGRTGEAGNARAMAYVWAWRDSSSIDARFFFPKHGAVIEDPGTGSACANLGGWLIANGAERPVAAQISQGAAVGRPCRLGLDVTADQRILVSGRVVDFGRGSVRL